MNVTRQLRALFDAVVAEADRNPAFAARLADALTGLDAAPPPAMSGRAPKATSTPSAAAPRKGGRRAPAALDPFAVYTQSEPALRARLGELSVDQLKDVVAEHGMDPSKLAMRWKTPGKLIDLIATTVRDRSEKGDAFR
jgi:hypothetical protein